MLIKYTGKYVNIYFIMKVTCSVDLTYEEYESWSQEMLAHEKYRKSLASKSKGRGKV